MTDIKQSVSNIHNQGLKRKTAAAVHVWPGLHQFGMSQVEQLLPDLHSGLDDGLSMWSSGTLGCKEGRYRLQTSGLPLSEELHVLSVVNTLNMHKHWRAPGSTSSQWKWGGEIKKEKKEQKKQLQNIQCMMLSQK